MNKITLKGNLTGDPETKTLNNEKQTIVTNFSVAVTRPYKPDKTDFFRCVGFGKNAEFIQKYFSKGTPILLSGHMENNNYRNKDNENVYGYSLIIEDVEFAGGKTNKTQDEQPAQSEENDDSYVDEPFDFMNDVMPYGGVYD